MIEKRHPIEKLFLGAFFALVLGITIHHLLPSFFSRGDIFWILFLLFTIQIMEGAFGKAVEDGLHALKFVTGIVLAIPAFILLRFTLESVTGIFPITAYKELGESNGLVGAFWADHPWPHITREVVICVILGGLVFGLVRGQRWAKALAMFLGLFIVFGTLIAPTITIASVARYNAAEKEIGNSIAKDGVVPTVKSLIPSSETQTDVPQGLPGAQPALVDAYLVESPKDMALMDMRQSTKERVEIALQKEGLAGPYKTSCTWKDARFQLVGGPGSWVRVKCDGQPISRVYQWPALDADQAFNHCAKPGGEEVDVFFLEGSGVLQGTREKEKVPTPSCLQPR